VAPLPTHFRDDHDRQRYLDTLEEVRGKTGWQIHASSFMGNHLHLPVETPS
jgi:REP element-mobilizing transposase RayT